MNFQFLNPKEQIAEILSRIYRYGLTTTSGGNISMRDEAGNIWITPSAVDKGSLTAEDIVFIDTKGRSAGPHRPSSELPFHQAIYRERSDIRAIIHAHPPVLVAFSLIKRVPNTKIIPQAYHVCGKVALAPYESPGSEALGNSIAGQFKNGANSVIMENHGTVVGGTTLLDTFARFETLEFCAHTEAQASFLGNVSELDDHQIKRFHRKDAGNTLDEFEVGEHSERELIVRSELIKVIRRAYTQKLIISSFGTFSARLDEHSYLISPTQKDRFYLQREDLVLMTHGKKEKGKTPSRSFIVHEEIYRQHPSVNAVIFAQSPNATAFAVARVQMETRTIPESYILLREFPLLAFGDQYQEGKEISRTLSPETPILFIENESILVTGKSILECFDRLEVAEFSARSLILAGSLGQPSPIRNEDILALKKKFNL